MRVMAMCAGLALALSMVPLARGQDAGAAKLELVFSASGEPAVPWVERELCGKSTGKCAIALMNPETGEVARMGDQLGTDFERTNNGQEIRRAETTADRLARLRDKQ
jgi:hypothetical protein